MILKKSEDGGHAPIYCYTFDDAGFFQGQSRRQPDPLQPGTWLMPRNSTEIKPPMKEGFLPKWNGVSWDLIEAKSGVEKKVQFQNEFALRQQQAFEALVANAEKVVRVEIDRRWNELMKAFETQLEAFRQEIKGRVELGLGEAKERVVGESRAEVGLWLDEEMKRLVVQRGELEKGMVEIRRAEHELRELHSEVLQKEHAKKKAVDEELANRSLLGRLFGGSQSAQS